MTSENVGRRRLPSSALPAPMLLSGRMVTFFSSWKLLICWESPQVAILPGQSGSVLVHKAMEEESNEEEEVDKLKSEKLVDRMASVLNTGQLNLQQLVAYNDAEEKIYFTAEDPDLPGSAHLYTLDLPPTHPMSSSPSSTTHHLSSPLPVCISCHQNDPSCLSSKFTAAPKVTQPCSMLRDIAVKPRMRRRLPPFTNTNTNTNIDTNTQIQRCIEIQTECPGWEGWEGRKQGSPLSPAVPWTWSSTKPGH